MRSGTAGMLHHTGAYSICINDLKVYFFKYFFFYLFPFFSISYFFFLSLFFKSLIIYPPVLFFLFFLLTSVLFLIRCSFYNHIISCASRNQIWKIYAQITMLPAASDAHNPFSTESKNVFSIRLDF